MTDTIGQRLKREREHRNLTLEKAAEATRIRQGYLRALEADDISALPSPVQARGFLRNYAQYLDLDLDQMVEELRATHPEQKSGTEIEVHFEGELPIPSSAKKEVKPEIETEETTVGSSAEPFWQTWLRRAKSEVGEPDRQEESASRVEASSSSPVEESATKPSPRRMQDDLSQTQAGENGTRPVQAGKHPKPTAVSGPDSASRTGASQTVESEAVTSESSGDKKPKSWSLLLERIKSRLPRKQAKPAPEVEIVEKPAPEPEPEPESEPLTGPAISSQEIINEIGMQLRRRREMLSLTLDEIERHTRLRAEIMAALEKGNLDELPSPVQTRGMLANYAGFLDLEVDTLLLRFADALQARHRERHPEKPARRRGQPIIPENLPAFRTFIAGDVVFGIGMVLLLVGFSIWGLSRVIALQSEQGSEVQAEATGPSISEALIGTPVETVVSEVTLIPAEDTPIPDLPAGTVGAEGTFEVPTLATNANVQLNIVALERSFLRVTVDGELAFEGRTIPGNAYPFEAEGSIEILAGNGSALRVIYNQRDMGLLGGFGQIASFIYTTDEILVPTPAMSPTVTDTPFISPTPSITPPPTISPSPTPTPSDLSADA
jgi:cytoskeletal protein RodZ